MKLLFLGTGAWDYADIFSEAAALPQPKDKRRSSSLLINSELLIDCGDLVPYSFQLFCVDKSKIKTLLITHTHCDHFRVDHIRELAVNVPDGLDVYGNSSVAEALDGIPEVRTHVLTPLTAFSSGSYSVMPLAANHRIEQTGEQALAYVIETEGKRLFYGCDGAWLRTDTAKYLFEARLNCAVFDCTVGDYDGDFRCFEHNSIPMLRTMLCTLRKQNTFAENASIYGSHLAPSLHADFITTEHILKEMGMLLPYDGYTAEI